MSLKNTKFVKEYLEFIYPRELEIKETTETAASSSYLDCYLYIDNGKLTTRLYDKRDGFNFPIVNFPFLSGVYVSQLIHYARTCSNVCWSEHSDSSFVYGFMSLDYGLGTLTATTFPARTCPNVRFLALRLKCVQNRQTDERQTIGGEFIIAAKDGHICSEMAELHPNCKIALIKMIPLHNCGYY